MSHLEKLPFSYTIVVRNGGITHVKLFFECRFSGFQKVKIAHNELEVVYELARIERVRQIVDDVSMQKSLVRLGLHEVHALKKRVGLSGVQSNDLADKEEVSLKQRLHV